MTQNNVLNIKFITANDGKKHNVRIKNAKQGLDASTIKGVANTLISNHFFDFGGDYSLYNAVYTSTSKTTIVDAND